MLYIAPSFVPQLLQNIAAEETGAPQLGQTVLSSGAPQISQNLPLEARGYSFEF